MFSAPPNRFGFTLITPKGLYREGCDGEHYWREDGKDIGLASGRDLEEGKDTRHGGIVGFLEKPVLDPEFNVAGT